MAFDPRRAAHRVLLEIDRSPVGSQEALSRVLDGAGQVDPRDRGLLTELVYGTLRWRRRLDHVLATFTPRGLPLGDDATMEALRLGAYQLLFLSRIPSWGAVDTTVRLVKRHGGQGKARFANAVLRSLARRREDPPPPPEGSSIEALAIRHSLPTWVLEQLQASVPATELEARLQAENEPAPLWARVNTLRTDAAGLAERLSAEGAEARPVAGMPATLELLRAGDALRGAALREGLWLPQDRASQLVVELVDARPGQRVLDLCAGVGVKTTRLAEMTGPEGVVHAVDVAPGRIAQLRNLCQRWGVDWATSWAQDATAPLPAERSSAGYDRILVDAPCTGLGTMRRRPEIRWRRSATDLRELAALQRRLVENALTLLRPGGRLVYAVCTFTHEEGTGVVADVLTRHPEIRVVPPPPDHPASANFDDFGYLRTGPERDGADAFFAVALERPTTDNA